MAPRSGIQDAYSISAASDGGSAFMEAGSTLAPSKSRRRVLRVPDTACSSSSKRKEYKKQQQIINTENTLFISKIGLCQILLLEDYASFDISDEVFDIPLTNISNETQETILVKARESVKEVKIALSNVDLAKKDLAISRSSYLPTLTGFVGYNTRWSESTIFNFADQLYFY